MAQPVLCVLALALLYDVNASGGSYYRGAVVDYVVIQNSSNSRENLMANVRNFEVFIKTAAIDQKADIIVFPECSLLGIDDYTTFLMIPNPKDNVVPAGNASWDEAIKTLSAYAKRYEIYLVVNIHENYTDPKSRAYFRYNTNVVFDRNGMVISRYRKYNLFNEDVDTTAEPEYAIFDTDFGVKFGQFVCFDILYKEPALDLVKKHKISNFVYPTWWFSVMPFFTAAQAQWSWAVGNNVNLLAAGANHIARGSVGSSIILGKTGNFKTTNYLFSKHSASTLIVANIPKEPGNSVPEDTFKLTVFHGQDENFGMTMQPDVENFPSAEILLPTDQNSVKFVKQICHSKFCCSFNLDISYENTMIDTISYKAVAFSGIKSLHPSEPKKLGIEICGVYAYSEHVNKLPFSVQKIRKVFFDNVEISGNFRYENSEILPNVLLHPGADENFLPKPSDVKFEVGDDISKLIWSPQTQIITAGIYSRTFTGASNSVQISNFAILLSVTVAVFFSFRIFST